MAGGARINRVRVPNAVQRERAHRDGNESCSCPPAHAGDAPLIRDRRDRACGDPASAAQRGSTCFPNRKRFARAVLRAGHGHVARCVIAALMVSLAIAVAPARGEGMKYPNWESQWRRTTAGGTGGNSWDPTRPIGLGQGAPLTSEHQAIFEAGLKAQKTGVQGNTPGSTCLLPGMPKVMNFSEPMEIIIRPTATYFVPLRYPTRRIYTDGRSWPADEPPTLGGYSIGKWLDEDGDGVYDVLEVETRNFKGPRVFESSGLPLDADNRTVIKERIYLDRNDRNKLHDDITTIDHALTRPWTIDRVVAREAVRYWVENSCHEANVHLRIGKDEYFLSADDKLMPVRADQPPPDLSYFETK